MEMYIKQEFGRSFVVADYEVEKDDEYLISMITENDIKGLLTCREAYEGSSRKLKYDVTNMIALSHEFENRCMDFPDIKELFEGIKAIFDEGVDYLLDDAFYIFDPDYIFRDIEHDCYKMLYLPGFKAEASVYHKLADFLLQKVNRKDNACIQSAYQFYRMSGSDTFSVPMFMNIIEKEAVMSRRQMIVPERTSEEDYVSEEPKEPESEKNDDESSWWVKPAVFGLLSAGSFSALYFYKGLYASYVMLAGIMTLIISLIYLSVAVFHIIEKKKEERIVVPQTKVTVEDYWSGDEETVVFREETEVFFPSEQISESDIRLEWKENNVSKKYMIRDFPVTIGKLIGEVDCRISDSSISRLHAKIVKRNNKLVIFDLNSTNGTCVDGVKLLPGEETVIDMDSRILLGNVMLRLV